VSTAQPIVEVIEPRPPGLLVRLPEVWRYRRLIGYFGKELLEKLYRRTWLGPVWIPLRPVVTVVTSAFVFGGLLGVDTGPIPYLLWFLLTNALWDLFSNTMLWGTRSLEIGRRVLRRMYAPRLTCLLGSLVIAGALLGVYVVMILIALAAFLISDGELYLTFGVETLAAPAGLLLAVLLALGVACFTAPYALRARDVRFAVAYFLGFWMFLSPVAYPLSHVPESYRTIIELNPVTAPLELFRLGIFGQGEVPATSLASCLLVTALVVGGGLLAFNRAEEEALDAL
jgi:lipopolysaccharide transport system permease protein